MDKTPIKVYEDKQVEVLKTPLSGIKRLNITPVNQPLSPKDVNVQTPAIFRPKKLQIPDIFSPISKIKNLQTRKKYTMSNDENCENFVTEGKDMPYDAVTSTPILPKRNRKYHCVLVQTPKTNKNKIVEKRTNAGIEENVKRTERPARANFDICNLRRNNLKENFTTELKAVLQSKAFKSEESKKQTEENLLQINVQPENQLDNKAEHGNNKEPSPKIKIETSNSFEELKARFERVKMKAENTIDKSLCDKIAKKNDKFTTFCINNKQKDLETSSPRREQVVETPKDDKSKLVDNHQNTGCTKTSKPFVPQSNAMTILESSAQETESNTNFYTALPESNKKAFPPFSTNGSVKPCQYIQKVNDLSGIQSIPRSTETSTEVNTGPKSPGSNKKPVDKITKQYASKIPKLNIERSNKLEIPSVLIRDEDIDRITYKLKLGNENSLNSASKERAAFRHLSPLKFKSEPKSNTHPNKGNEISNQCKSATKTKLLFESPLEKKRKKYDAPVKDIKDAVMKDDSPKNSKLILRNNKTKSEPRKITSSVKITRQNRSEVIKTSALNGELGPNNINKRKLSFTSKTTTSEVSKISNANSKLTSHNCSTNISSTPRSSSKINVDKSYKECSQSSKTKNTNSKHESTKAQLAPNTIKSSSTEESPLNSTFLVQSSNSRHCYCSIPKKSTSCPHSGIAKYNLEFRSKSVKSSLEKLGDWFKFRKKSKTFSPNRKNNLKRSYSFIHFSVKGKKNAPKSLLDIYSYLDKESPCYFTDEESSHSYPSAKYPKHVYKKKKRLRNLLKNEYLLRKSPEEGEGQVQKVEQSYEKCKNNVKATSETNIKTEVQNSNKIESRTHPFTQNSEQLDSIEPYPEHPDDRCDIPSHTTNQVPLEADIEYHRPQQRQKLISVDIENESLSDESDDCIVFNDEYFKSTHKILNNEKELLRISESVHLVESELEDLSKLHKEIKDDLVIQWTCQQPFKTSSSSDDISEGNCRIKDGAAVDGSIPLRNAATAGKVTKHKVKSQLQLPTPKLPRSPNSTQTGVHPSTSRNQSQSSRIQSVPSPNEERIPYRIQSVPNEDKQSTDKYRIFLEEQNYRAIQMIESRLTRVEEKLSVLQSITLDIRNLLQVKVDSVNGPKTQAPPPPPPPLPPPPSNEMLFFPLRSSTSHSSSLSKGARTRSSPRAKSLRPAITVDDLRSVTLKKVSKEQIQSEVTVAHQK
ncbi:E3 ubiquitin-protein ligase RBBP6-like isoform X1 [Diaphorina citri]|uniref:E3 ubiquitin-protein ligase RBBP6-like isoform X1 n=1 Tax=Diaphorina citri TaxID=121845 RepID=A0A3Q0J8I1_DIACI|nr:E3 ubiquitin-protein ligase RBBP6-like isoform X1 [Diaphorina citri]